MTNSIDLSFNKIVAAVAQRMLQFGFKRSGNTIRLISGGNAAIVEFQKSRSNTSEQISFTVNAAIVCGVLLDPDTSTIQKSRAVDGHLRRRIGTFLPDRQDKWWQISSATDPDSLLAEVADIICDGVVPYLLRYVDTSELLALWESGEAPGLTEGARVRKLEALKNKLKKGQI